MASSVLNLFKFCRQLTYSNSIPFSSQVSCIFPYQNPTRKGNSTPSLFHCCSLLIRVCLREEKIVEVASMEEVVSKDMISGLPEDLLVTILMYLPIKDAVATMILSKRWRFTWMMMDMLEYEDSDDDDESKKSVWWLLDKSMQLHKAPILAFLYMKLGPRCPSDADVGKWIAKAVDRGVVYLELDLLWSSVDPVTSLPKTLYLCESLEKLFLSHKILVDVPSTACLPSLTKLHLNCVVYENEDSLINLLASCPILEFLYVCREKDDNVKKFTVKSPCLLGLHYLNGDFRNDVEDTSRCLVIDTPTLTKFDFLDISEETCSIENLSCLEQVHIRAPFSWSIPDTQKFLRSFSKVLTLVLDLSRPMVACCGTIKFPRLKECTILPCNTDWMDSLIPLLQNTPKLNSLTVNYKSTDSPPIASISWRESSYDPECLSSSLENFASVGYGGIEEEEEELVEYILTNAKCLKTATIFMKSTLTLAEKDTVMEKLRAIPRISKTSKLLFNTLVHNWS